MNAVREGVFFNNGEWGKILHLVGLRMGDKMCKIADGKRGGRKERGGEVDVIRTFFKITSDRRQQNNTNGGLVLFMFFAIATRRTNCEGI